MMRTPPQVPAHPVRGGRGRGRRRGRPGAFRRRRRRIQLGGAHDPRPDAEVDRRRPPSRPWSSSTAAGPTHPAGTTRSPPCKRAGYPVIAPANPLRGLTSDADYIRSVLQTIDGPIVLVGHSYGGAVISNAAAGVPNVEALVYIAAFAPDSGESLAQLVTMNPGTHITPDALTERPYPLPDGTNGIDLYIKAERVPRRLRRRPAAEHDPPDAGHPTARSRSPRSPSPPVSRPGRPSRPGT